MKAHLDKGELVLTAETTEDREFLHEAFDKLRLKQARLVPTSTHLGEKLTLEMRKETPTKYRLLIRMWIKQDKLYSTAAAAKEAGEKIAQPEDVAVEPVEE